MADVFTKAKRSEVMSRIRGQGNKNTELALAKLFRRHHLTGWRRQFEIRGRNVVRRRRRPDRGRKLPMILPSGIARRTAPIFRVKPDFVFPKIKLAVFVDGCFWHGCPKHATWPTNRAAWWRRKIQGNQARDMQVTRVLRRTGWRVLRVWEHDLQRAARDSGHEARLMRRITAAISH